MARLAPGWLQECEGVYLRRKVFPQLGRSSRFNLSMEVQPSTEQVGLPPCTEVLGAPPVIITIGAAIKFHRGKVVPSPRWASRVGLEWLWRLLHGPRTVWRRAPICGHQFMALSLLDLTRHKRNPGDGRSGGGIARSGN